MTTSNIPKRAPKELKTFSVSAMVRGIYFTVAIAIAIYMVVKILTS